MSTETIRRELTISLPLPAEDVPADITLNAVSASASPTFTYTIVVAAGDGVLSGSGPTFTYTPAPDYNGPDSFTFRVNDGSHDSNTSTVNITITEVNDAPVATDDAASTNEDSHCGSLRRSTLPVTTALVRRTRVCSF